MYRDGANYKACNTVVVEGSMSFSDIEKYLKDGSDFIPFDVGMDELQEQLRGFPNEDDHAWHELSKESFDWLIDVPTADFTAKDLIRAFKKAHKKGWQVDKAVRRLGLK
jgi:hypothetical protein